MSWISTSSPPCVYLVYPATPISCHAQVVATVCAQVSGVLMFDNHDPIHTFCIPKHPPPYVQHPQVKHWQMWPNWWAAPPLPSWPPTPTSCAREAAYLSVKHYCCPKTHPPMSSPGQSLSVHGRAPMLPCCSAQGCPLPPPTCLHLPRPTMCHWTSLFVYLQRSGGCLLGRWMVYPWLGV